MTDLGLTLVCSFGIVMVVAIIVLYEVKNAWLISRLIDGYIIMQTELCNLHNSVCIMSKNIRIFAAGN